MESLRIGYAITGSFCTISRTVDEIKRLKENGADITPILSFNAGKIDTRFGKAEDLRIKLTEITGHKPLETLVEVEPIGPKAMFDVLVVVPCTGSTLGRLANGISDTPVTLAVKSHLRRSRPVILGVATNDALGASMRNISYLKNTKFVYFIPMRQDDPQNKPNSLVADFTLLDNTITAAMSGMQIQPLFL